MSRSVVRIPRSLLNLAENYVDYSLSLRDALPILHTGGAASGEGACGLVGREPQARAEEVDRKSTRLNSSHVKISYAVFCLKKKKKNKNITHYKFTCREYYIKDTTRIHNS